jgi:hypothetical protein
MAGSGEFPLLAGSGSDVLGDGDGVLLAGGLP